MRRRVWAGGLLAALPAGCATPPPPVAEDVAAHERRIVDLEREVAEQRRFAHDLHEVLKREEGLLVYPEPPRDAAERLDRAIESLRAAIARLEEAVASQNPERFRRASAAFERAVGTLGEEPVSAARRILAALDEASSETERARFVEALARIGGRGATETLRTLLADRRRPSSVRLQAGTSLLELDPEAALPVVEEVLSEEGDPPFRDLFLLVHRVGELGDPQTIPLLCRALARDADASVRCHAATTLGHFAEPRAARALEAAATADPHPSVRTNALRALLHAASEPREVIAVAERVLGKEEDAGVQAVAREVLQRASRGPLPGPTRPLRASLEANPP